MEVIAPSPMRRAAVAERPLTDRQQRTRAHFDRIAAERGMWLDRNRFFYESDRAYMRFLIPSGRSVLEIGCGTGDLLRALAPSRGVGIDISEAMIAIARQACPGYEFHAGNAEDPSTLGRISGPFDFIVLSDVVGYLEDCEAAFAALRPLCTAQTRIIVAYYSHLWEPVLEFGARIGMKMPTVEQNWLSTEDTTNLLMLSGYEVVRCERRQLLPKRLLGLGGLVNRSIGPVPGFRLLSLRTYTVARPLIPHAASETPPSCSVLIPCRNERGNIENVVRRLPEFADCLEIVLIEGHSTDGTYEECLRVRDAYPGRNIRVLRQPGKGKRDAVYHGIAAASGDILMILDADLTVPPEAMPKFYNALVLGRGEFVNGTRLVYPMAEKAMRHLNFFANRAFAAIFSYLLNQRFTDTLCGTKAFWRRDYDAIAADRGYLGDFDPFGDFDLLFGAAKLNLKIVELPIRYADRTYGKTQIERFPHGLLLARMVVFGWRKFKAL